MSHMFDGCLVSSLKRMSMHKLMSASGVLWTMQQAVKKVLEIATSKGLQPTSVTMDIYDYSDPFGKVVRPIYERTSSEAPLIVVWAYLSSHNLSLGGG